MSEEKVDVKKFLKGFTTPVAWWKSMSIVLKFLIIIFLIFIFYKAFFMKNQTQTQTARIVALPGSTINYSPQQQQKQEIKKRPWWLPIFFIESYGFIETTGNDSRTGIGGRAGGRLEF